MSRPIKEGLDYFPMDVDVDDKIELIEAKHGIIGFGIIIKLYQRIYKESYFLNWNEEALLLFSKRINVDINKINDVINDCFRYHLFDKNLHEKYQILTSSGIQKRYLNAVERRKTVNLYKNLIIVDINSINVDINWINDYISTQSKVKESKEEKRIEYIPNWKTDFEIYKTELREVYTSLIEDKEFISNQERYNPGIDIALSIEKACVNFWGTEAGWKKKKQSKSKDIDWKATLTNAISLNKVYKLKS